MSPLLRVVLTAGAAVLVFDAVVATTSRLFGFRYESAVIGSYLLYALAGYFGARAGGSIGAGILAAGAVGLVDSTLGWLISAAIGPGRPPAEAAATPAAIAAVVMMVPLLAGIIGLVGAVIARLLTSAPSPPA